LTGIKPALIVVAALNEANRELGRLWKAITPEERRV
jgi:hypothetical protein